MSRDFLEEPQKIQFPVGPNEFSTGILIKSNNKKERIPVSLQRFKPDLEVQLPNGDWYKVKKADFFGAEGM